MTKELPSDPVGNADRLTVALLAASQVMGGMTGRALGVTNESLTVPQFRALVALELGGPMSLTALADALDVKPSTAMRMIERLEKRDLAVRGASPDDRRQSLVLLTMKGRRIVESVSEHRAEEMRAVIERMPVDGIKHAIQFLTAFNEAYGIEIESHPPPL